MYVSSALSHSLAIIIDQSLCSWLVHNV